MSETCNYNYRVFWKKKKYIKPNSKRNWPAVIILIPFCLTTRHKFQLVCRELNKWKLFQNIILKRFSKCRAEFDSLILSECHKQQFKWPCIISNFCNSFTNCLGLFLRDLRNQNVGVRINDVQHFSQLCPKWVTLPTVHFVLFLLCILHYLTAFVGEYIELPTAFICTTVL